MICHISRIATYSIAFTLSTIFMHAPSYSHDGDEPSSHYGYDYEAVCRFIDSVFTKAESILAADKYRHVSITNGAAQTPVYLYINKGTSIVFARKLSPQGRHIITSASFNHNPIHPDVTSKHKILPMFTKHNIGSVTDAAKFECDASTLTLRFQGTHITNITVSANFVD